MAQLCKQCGESFESTANSCPYCQQAQGGQLPALGHASAADGNHGGGDAEQVHVVTAPVRKKRSLPMSCMMGALIFAPTIFLVAFLMFFYLKQNHLREELELQRNTGAKENTQKILHKLGDAMETLVLNARPELIVSIDAKSRDLLAISVKPEWNDLPEISQKDLHKRWLSKWQQLDGKQVDIKVAENENPSVEEQ